MDRYLVISSDCHAGLPPEQYRSYVDPKYRDVFDQALPIQVKMTKTMEESFLIADINAEWRKGHEKALTGAWDDGERKKVMDGDGVAMEIIFPDGITNGVMDDWDVWTNKIHLLPPVFCKADTPLIEFRRWAQQFYSKRD